MAVRAAAVCLLDEPALFRRPMAEDQSTPNWLKLGGLLGGIAALITAVVTALATVVDLGLWTPAGESGDGPVASPAGAPPASESPAPPSGPQQVDGAATLAAWPGDGCYYRVQAVPGTGTVRFPFGVRAEPAQRFAVSTPDPAAVALGAPIWAPVDERDGEATAATRSLKPGTVIDSRGGRIHVDFDPSSPCRPERLRGWFDAGACLAPVAEANR